MRGWWLAAAGAMAAWRGRWRGAALGTPEEPPRRLALPVCGAPRPTKRAAKAPRFGHVHTMRVLACSHHQACGKGAPFCACLSDAPAASQVDALHMIYTYMHHVIRTCIHTYIYISYAASQVDALHMILYVPCDTYMHTYIYHMLHLRWTRCT